MRSSHNSGEINGSEPVSPKDTAMGKACREMVIGVVDAFVDFARSEAQAEGGVVSAAKLSEYQARFMAVVENVAEPYNELFSNVLPQRTQSRKRPFHRLIVNRFEHLLVAPGKVAESDESLPREFLPGFFVALEKMLGEDQIAEYEQQCIGIIERIQANRGDGFSWNDVYSDEDANKLVIEPLIEIALRFEHLERRAAWFVDLVNLNIPSADKDEADASSERWQLSEWMFQRLLRAMFADLKPAIADESERIRIAHRHGPNAYNNLMTLLGRIGGGSDNGHPN